VFRQIAIGSSFQQSVVMDFAGDVVPYELTPLTLFVGDGGTGKSTLLDAFAFLADCINTGVSAAVEQRGGFDSIYHFGSTGPISIGVVYRPCAEQTTLTYLLNIDGDKRTRQPFVETEAIIYRDQQPGSQPRPVLLFQNGEKRARVIQPWVGAQTADLDTIKQWTGNQNLALASLAQFEDLPDIPQFKLYLNKFFVANYLSSNAAALSPPKFKVAPGGNLGLDLKRIKDKHSAEYEGILDVIARRLPGVEKIKYELSEVGRPMLTFNMTGLETALYPAQLGEGTLRLLSHLTLFEDPIPTPLMGIEDPAAFMGYSQIVAFVELIQHHIRELGGTQFFATTTSNILIDQMDPTEVWFLSRNDNGSIQASRGLDELQFLNVDLNSVGPYWYSQYLYPGQEVNESAGSIIQKIPIPPGG
jgi:predicted ATPase